MHIVRFMDEKGQDCYGHDYSNGKALRLAGNLFAGLEETGETVNVKKILAPLVPSAILAIGLNYHQHAEETGSKIPKYPVLFMKNPGSVTNPGDPILLHPSCMEPPEVDYEVELAVVIGKECRHVPREAALSHVAGYCCFMDGSVRDWQNHTSQFTPGKNFEKSGAMGPRVVPATEIPDPTVLELITRVNGQVMQQGRIADLVFDIPYLVEYISGFTRLRPGDVIATGTPGGVGAARKPPVWLRDGDLVEVEIPGIGTLRNPVRDEDAGSKA